jgi:hypothetical protein
MRPVGIHVTGVGWLASVPPTVAISERVAVDVGPWYGPAPTRAALANAIMVLPAGESLDPNVREQAEANARRACTPTVGRFSMRTIMIRSLVSKRWLIAQIDVTPGGIPRGVTVSGMSTYDGLASW